MGGYGSGRTSWRSKVEHCRSLDVNRLKRVGCLEPGYWGGWQWTEDGEKVASIGIRAEPGRIILKYRQQRYGEDWQDVEEPVPLETVSCHYGGARPYFRCPGVINGRHCGRRVAKLYQGGRYFLCRHCFDLRYTSQVQTRADRLLRRANKKRMALGGQPGTASLIPAKPKGMHERVYRKHIDEIYALEEEADNEFALWCMRRFGMPSLDDVLRSFS